MSSFFYTDHTDPTQIERFNREVLAKPEAQQAIAEYMRNPSRGSPQVAMSRLRNALRAAGMPDTMTLQIGADGSPSLVDRGGINWGNIIALGAAGAVGGFVLAGAASSAATGTTAATTGTGTSAGAGGGAAAGSTAATTAGSGSTLARIGSVARGAGSAISAATQAAGNNRINADDTQRQADKDFEDALIRRGTVERTERDNALDDVYRDSWYSNRQPGPNNTRGVPATSPAFQATLADLSRQGSTRLSTGPQYGTDVLDPLERFKPTRPSTMERAGTYAGPILSILGAYARR